MSAYAEQVAEAGAGVVAAGQRAAAGNAAAEGRGGGAGALLGQVLTEAVHSHRHHARRARALHRWCCRHSQRHLSDQVAIL